MKKINLINLLLFFLSIFGTLFLLKEYKKNPPSHHAMYAMKTDAFIKGGTFYQYDKSGRLHSQINATRVRHIPNQNTTYFDKPHILLYSNQKIPWYIAADYGKALQGTETIYLWGHVILNQPASDNYPKTTLLTSEIIILPHASLIKTDKNVLIKRDNGKLYAKGLVANTKTQVIHFLTQTKVFYDPQNSSITH